MDPLSARAVTLILLGVLVALEAVVGVAYQPPTPMQDKLDAYESSRTDARDLLILGTCLPEQTIQAPVLERELGDVEVHNLASQASSSLIWYLVVNGHLPDDGQVAGILIPYGTDDLTTLMNPAESQVMDLARLVDLPMLMRLACATPDCALDMGLRKLSHAYRYRGKLAKQVWSGLGIEGGESGEDGGSGPEGVTGGFDPHADIQGGPRAPGEQHEGPPPPVLEIGGPDPTQPPSFDMGWQASDSAPSEDRVALYLDALVAAAKRQDIPVVFAPLPRNPAYPDQRPHSDVEKHDQLIDQLRAAGATHLDLGDLAGLGPEHFEDDVHLLPDGREVVTLALGRELKRAWR